MSKLWFHRVISTRGLSDTISPFGFLSVSSGCWMEHGTIRTLQATRNFFWVLIFIKRWWLIEVNLRTTIEFLVAVMHSASGWNIASVLRSWTIIRCVCCRAMKYRSSEIIYFILNWACFHKKGNLLLWLIFSVSRELQYCSGLDDFKWSQSQQPVNMEDKALSKSLKWQREVNGKHLRLTSIEVLYNLMF